MFDGEHIVVPKHPQRGDQLTPPLRAVAISTCAKDPGAIAFFRVRLRVENAAALQINWIELRVLGMHMENGVCQHANGADGVDCLPEKMARIKVATDVVSRNRAESKHGLWVIHDEPGMHLDSNLHAVVGGKPRMLHPIGNDHFIPLPLENLAIVRRPWTGHPIRCSRVWRIPGTPREIDYDRHT